jgi:protein-tyrosine phosphatase
MTSSTTPGLLPAPSLLRAVLFAPYRAAFYPFLALRRAAASLHPARGGPWRTWVSPSILVGGFLYPSDAAALVRDGIGAVVNVSRELIEPVESLQAAGLAYLQVPAWDGRVPDLPDARRGVAFIADHVAAGRKVYVHCASGVGRSISLVLCYRCAHEGKGLDDELAAITRARPRVSLSRVQRAFVEEYVAAHRAKHRPDGPPTGALS